MARRLHVKALVGSRTRANQMYPSEAGYAEAMAQTSKAITASLLDILDQFEEASPEIMIEALEPTLEITDALTPKDTGELVESHYLEETSFRGKPRVEIGYAKGGSPYYAMYVHEMVGIPHAEPTRSKFLQAGVMQDLDNIEKRLVIGYQRFMNAK